MERNENIRKELEEVAPLLSSLNTSLPFIVPANYFDELEDSVLSAAGISRRENQVVEKKPPFVVPPGYFETLPEAVLEKINKSKAVSRSPVRTMAVKWWLAAAAITVIVIISVSVIRNHSPLTIASGNEIDTTSLMLESAASLPEAVLVEYYSSDASADDNDSSLNRYLIEASGIDQEIIFSL